MRTLALSAHFSISTETFFFLPSNTCILLKVTRFDDDNDGIAGHERLASTSITLVPFQKLCSEGSSGANVVFVRSFLGLELADENN